MDRPASFQRTTQPNISRGPNFNKYHLSDRKVDDDLTKKIFLSIEEGDISKIKENFNNNSSSYFVRLDNGEGILHAIIKSSNLSKHDKLNLTKFVIQRGAPIGAFDQQNITPLHLASKLQLTEIIKLLLEKGADTSSLDSQYMNSLHYLVQGNIKPCENLKVDKLIKGNTEKHSTAIKKLLDNLITFIHNEKTINIHLKHIKNTLNITNLYQLYDLEFDKILKANLTEITKIVQDMSLDETEKRKKILILISNCRISLEQFVLKDTKILNPLEIAPNTNNGWGVDNDPARKVLPYKSIYDIVTEIEEEYDKNSIKSKVNAMRQLTQISKNSKEIQNTVNGAYLNLNNIFQLANNFFDNTAIAIPPKIINLFQGSGNANVSRLDIDDVSLPAAHIKRANYINSLPEIPRGTLAQIEQWKKTHTRFAQLPLSLLNGAPVDQYIGPNPTAAGTQLGTIANPLIGPAVADFFLDEIYSYCQFINENMANLRNSLEELGNQMDNEIYVYSYQKHISYQIIKLLNICAYLSSINSSIANLENVVGSLSDEISSFYGNNTGNSFAYLLDHAQDQAQQMKSSTKNLSSKLEDTYRSILEMINVCNNIMHSIHIASGKNFIMNYHNIDDADQFANFSNNDGLNFEGYQRKLYLPSLPTSLQDFPDPTYYPTNDDYKKIIIEKFVLQITSKNYSIYNIGDDEKGLFGPASPFAYYDTLGRHIINNIPLVRANLGFIFDKNVFGLPTDPVTLETIGIPGLIGDIQPSHMGTIGIQDATQINRINPAPPIIQAQLENHLFLIRYRIMQFILLELNKPENDLIKKDLHDMLVNELQIIHPNPIVDTVIAKLVDELLIFFIKHQISKSSYTLASNLVKQSKLPLDEIISDKLVLLNKDTDFSLRLGETINSLVHRYFSGYTKITAMTYSLDLVMDEPKEKDNNNEIIFGNNLCITIKPDIIDLLAKYRININQRNIAGESPIFYAIGNQHFECIKSLITHGAFVHSIKNKSGASPFNLILNKFEEYYKNLDHSATIHKLTKSSYEKLRDIMLKKPEYGNNILLYTENILPLLIALLNYQLLKITNQYPRYWTFADRTELFTLFSNLHNIGNTITSLPELLVVPSNNLSINRTLNYKLKELNEQKIIVDDKLKEFKHQLAELKKEKNKSTNLGPIDNVINELQVNYVKISQKRKIINSEIKKLTSSTTNIDTIISGLVLNTRTDIINRNDVVEELNNLVNLINFGKQGPEIDLHLYQHLWDNFLKNPANTNSLIYIHLMASKTIGKDISLYNTQQLSLMDFKNHIDKIENWYNKIAVPFARDYFELSQELSGKGAISIGLENFETENYALDKTFGILVHMVTATISTSFFYSVLKTIARYVEEILNSNQFSNKDQYAKYLETYITNIVYNNSDNTSELMKYIIKIMPSKIVKLTLGIYEGNSDPDRKIVTIDQLLEPVTQMIMNNSTLPMDESASVIINLKKFVFPYFKDYFDLFIKEAKNITDNYYKSIINEYKQIELLKLMLNTSS